MEIDADPVLSSPLAAANRDADKDQEVSAVNGIHPKGASASDDDESVDSIPNENEAPDEKMFDSTKKRKAVEDGNTYDDIPIKKSKLPQTTVGVKVFDNEAELSGEDDIDDDDYEDDGDNNYVADGFVVLEDSSRFYSNCLFNYQIINYCYLIFKIYIYFFNIFVYIGAVNQKRRKRKALNAFERTLAI